MARTNAYLNFMGQTEEAFNFYRVVFGTEFAMPIRRMSDVPPGPGVPQLSDAEKKHGHARRVALRRCPHPHGHGRP